MTPKKEQVGKTIWDLLFDLAGKKFPWIILVLLIVVILGLLLTNRLQIKYDNGFYCHFGKPETQATSADGHSENNENQSSNVNTSSGQTNLISPSSGFRVIEAMLRADPFDYNGPCPK